MEKITKKIVIAVIAVIIVLFLALKKKDVTVVLVSGLEQGIDVEIYLNDDLVFDSLVQQQIVLHQNFSVKASSGFNKIRVVSNGIGLDKEYSFFVLFRQWVVMGPYLNEDSSKVEFSFDNKYFKHYLK